MSPPANIWILLILFAFQVEAQESIQDVVDTRTTGPDWIPLGSVEPAVERRALEVQARIETRIPEFQRAALDSIRSDLERYDHQEMRVATVPLVIDLLDLDYRILEFPRDYRIDGTTRLLALEILSELGGPEARAQIRSSVTSDDDGSIRAGAARLLATTPGSEPDTDLEIVALALNTAVRRGSPESEVRRLLDAARLLVPRVWDPEVPELLDALVAIHQGAYSGVLRRDAMAFLEWLSDL